MKPTKKKQYGLMFIGSLKYRGYMFQLLGNIFLFLQLGVFLNMIMNISLAEPDLSRMTFQISNFEGSFYSKTKAYYLDEMLKPLSRCFGPAIENATYLVARKMLVKFRHYNFSILIRFFYQLIAAEMSVRSIIVGTFQLLQSWCN